MENTTELSENILFQVEKNKTDIMKTVLMNTIKMLTSRNLLNKTNLDNNINNVLNNINEDMVIKIQTDNHENDYDKIFSIKYIPEVIMTTNNIFGINDFLNENLNNSKIIIVKGINKKYQLTLLNTYRYLEIFMESELMINLIDHELIPEVILLNKKQMDQVLNEYLCTKRQLPRMFHTDPLARYYNLKIGDICKIIRCSKTSALVVSYRLIIFGYIKPK